MMPAQLVARAVAMFSNALTKSPDFRLELFARHLVEVVVHAADFTRPDPILPLSRRRVPPRIQSDACGQRVLPSRNAEVRSALFLRCLKCFPERHLTHCTRLLVPAGIGLAFESARYCHLAATDPASVCWPAFGPWELTTVEGQTNQKAARRENRPQAPRQRQRADERRFVSTGRRSRVA